MVKINYLMKGMEKEKYLKPHFSKYFKPLMDYLYDNTHIYNIPEQIKDNKEGIFMFPDSAAPMSSSKLTAANPTNAVATPINHLRNNSAGLHFNQASQKRFSNDAVFEVSDFTPEKNDSKMSTIKRKEATSVYNNNVPSSLISGMPVDAHNKRTLTAKAVKVSQKLNYLPNYMRRVEKESRKSMHNQRNSQNIVIENDNSKLNKSKSFRNFVKSLLLFRETS